MIAKRLPWPGMSPLLLAAAMLAACAESGAPVADSDPNEVAAVDIAAESDGVAPGSWQSAGAGDSASVAFRSPNGEVLFSIGCDVRGGLLFERHGFVPRADLGLMQLRTGDGMRRLATTQPSDGQAQVQARAPYNDQLIPALIRFDQPLEVRIDGFETLILPPSPMVRELTQRCQRGDRPAAAPAEAN